MEALPARARAYVAGVALLALLCLLPLPVLPSPGLPPGGHVPWTPVVLLAALYAGCERVARSRLVAAPDPGGRIPPGRRAGAVL
ncbi:metal-dependent phosphohydrolase, partial [Streptomyces pilosus]